MHAHPLSRREFVAAASALAASGLAAACARGAATRHHGSEMLVLVGTYTQGARREGVFRFLMDMDSGALRPAGALDAGPNPSFLALHPDGRTLYAVNEVGEFAGRPSGALAALTLDGAPREARRATGGGGPCYVSVHPTGRFAFVANYTGGSVALFPVGPDGALGEAAAVVRHEGTGPNAGRQEAPHAHCILPDPSGRFAVATDLGADRILVYRLDERARTLVPAATPSVATRPGAGPRHLAWSADGRVLYAINELDLTVSTYRWDGATGTLSPVETAVLLRQVPAGEHTAADLHLAPSGRHLYASVRGADRLVVFALDPETGVPARVQELSSGGRGPRNFAIDPGGRFLLAANERSNTIASFRVDADSGRLEPTGLVTEVPSPVCVRFAAA